MYNVGDQLIVKCKDTITCKFTVANQMRDYCNKKVTIKDIAWADYQECNQIHLIEDNSFFNWSDDSFVGKVGEIPIQSDIAIICNNNKEILKVLNELMPAYRLGIGSDEEVIVRAETGMFLLNRDSFGFGAICSDYSAMYTYVEYADMFHSHDEYSIRNNNSCLLLYNELNHCGLGELCAKCTL